MYCSKPADRAGFQPNCERKWRLCKLAILAESLLEESEVEDAWTDAGKKDAGKVDADDDSDSI